jgi:predicted TIM-barrel fold metal-dependent hydrolase
MDAGGVTMQVLSCLTTQQLPRDAAVELVRAANDRAAAAVRARPGRFGAFAALPTAVPAAAADELKRGTGDLGFVGAMIFGRTEGAFLDEPRFDPVLRALVETDVPLYLHPGFPPAEVSAQSYAGGLDPLVTARMQTSAWGWHQETAVHFLHLVLAGVFDRYPTLQVILGHWGEMIPFYLDRLDEALPQAVTGLDRTIGDVVRQNTWITPSGMFSHAQLRFCIDTVGVDRILYAVDYPFIGNDDAATFLEQADLPEEAKAAIAHGNTERLLRLA